MRSEAATSPTGSVIVGAFTPRVSEPVHELRQWRGRRIEDDEVLSQLAARSGTVARYFRRGSPR